MKILKIKLLIFLTISSIFFSGCSATHEGPTYGEKVDDADLDVSAYKLNSVAVLDKDLLEWGYFNISKSHTSESKISVENLGIRSLETRNVEVFATIRNRTDHPLQVKIRSQFYDDNKIPTEKPSIWKRVFLAKNSSMTYKEKSVTIDDVTNFLIEIKEGD